MARIRLFHVIVLLMVSATLAFSPAAAEERMTLMTDAGTIEAGMGFDGCRLAIAGETPAGSQVYVKIVGPAQTSVLSRRGRKGPVWLAVEAVRVQGMPALYQVLSSNGLDLPDGVRRATGIGPDYAPLYAGARVLSGNEEHADVLPPDRSRTYLDDLVRAYEKGDLYRLIPKGIHVNGTSYAGNVYLPPEAPRGEIRLTAYAVRDGRVVAQAQRTVTVRNTWLVRLMDAAARQEPAAYGITAIIVALATGLAVAQIFRRLNGLAGKEKGLTAGQ
ncbi:MAG: TIGR02186 family protein [Thermoanaerobacterales bacterium]|nr:TIGR02186 family protein [Thermoanaerobacterales bacterium]